MTAPKGKTERSTACLLIIGNEVLSGRTKDANLAFLGERLNELGVRMAEARVLPDDEAVIVETLNAVRAKFDYVFTTGGIGPTHDDITAACIAKAFGKKLIRHPDAVALFEKKYAIGELNEARLKMTEVPEGAVLVDNPVSQAPGFRIENVYVFAGIPRVMQAMFEGIKHELAGGARVLSRTVASHAKEGDLAAGLGALQNDYPDVEIGSYPFFSRDGQTGVRVVVRSPDRTEIDAVAERVRALVRAAGGEPVDEAVLGAGAEDLSGNKVSA
jgi:molybdenum cofactor synthesis domain-containing protein